MAQTSDKDRLEALDERLKKARSTKEAKAREDRARGNAALGRAWRIAIELVVAVAVGGGIGWYLDKWLDTGPWLFIIFFFLGVAAGFRNVYKAAQMMGNQPPSEQDKKDE